MKHILTANDMEIARMIEEELLTCAQIAAKLGICSRTVDRRRQWPEMTEYRNMLSGVRAEALKEKAEAETKANLESMRQNAKDRFAAQVDKIALTSITPLMIITRLWELACLGPDVTRGNIEGQQQALDSIWIKMGYQGPAPRVDDLQNSTTRPDVYQAEWMRKPQ